MTTRRSAGESAAMLRRRWDPDQLADVRRQLELQARIVRGPHLIASPQGTTPQGLLDLRGLTPRTADDLSIRYLSVERLDLSHARGRLHVFETEVRDSCFDRLSASDSLLDRLFERCSFRSARLSKSRIGRRLVDCDFTGASLRKLTLGENTVFERCTLDAADLTDATLIGGRFVDCTFDGVTVSPLTTFDRCEFRGTLPGLDAGRRTRCTHDGVPVPARWEGQSAARELEDEYLDRYRRAVRDGDADTMPLGPESPPQ
ncbi:pentapeptide repeat-containing protein [Rhodococcus sp. BE178]|uniref:pentapeptide repeat-containing protein n=1 Tax=Rhodococcus sp. BE178 TaxID=2817737 RepID=UPI003D1A2709